MTEYAIPPIMLPTTTSNHNNVIRRRSSIRRGTIASICKDVRVNDVVEIIKKQKALQQQERNVGEDKLLKRRHSMMNLRPKSVIAVVNNNKVSDKQMAKSRLVVEEGVIGHLRKCVACNHPHEEEDCGNSSTDSSEEDNCLSPSTSSSSSSAELIMRPFIHKKINEEESNTLVEDVEQRGQLIQNLNSSITGYSTHIKEFIHNSPYYNEHEYKTKVDTCKALVAQQQSLLDKLQTTITTTIQPPSSTLPSQPFLPPALAPSPAPADEPTPVTTTTNISPIKSLYTEIYKGLKSSTTGFTIKQKKDKNDADTIIAVKGVCTTVEASLIPDRLRATTTQDDITTFHQSSVYQHQYSLEITQHDRLTKYILMHPDQWQKDEKVNTCSFKNCPHTFNWFQRKHHCRGCGQIYCNTHSGNRLPLFDKEAKPVFSRVCDNCFYHLAAHSLS